jgi:hypothetical protein
VGKEKDREVRKQEEEEEEEEEDTIKDTTGTQTRF